MKDRSEWLLRLVEGRRAPMSSCERRMKREPLIDAVL